MTLAGQSRMSWGKISDNRGVLVGIGTGGFELSAMGLRYLAILVVVGCSSFWEITLLFLTSWIRVCCSSGDSIVGA